jgi:valyl-tRNA synthetase
METGYDIIFFWVARMMMLGLFCTGVEPFHTVYLHGMIRAEGGVKMSKTKGNAVDALDLINEIGADALRFALTVGTAPGSDQRLTGAKVEGSRNFTNKLWNAARFVIGARPEPLAAPDGEPALPERWIRSRLAETIQRATRQLNELDTAGYAAGAYDFAWSDYCDWFIEAAKLELRREDASAGELSRVWRTAAMSLADTLRLLHPIVPFVTEAIWEQLHALDAGLTNGEPLLVSAAWPGPGKLDEESESQMADLIELVRGVRNLRAEAKVPAGAWIPMLVSPAPDADPRGFEAALRYLEPMARARPLQLRAAGEAPPTGAPAIASTLGAAWIDTDAAGVAGDANREAREGQLRQGIRRLEALLADEQFAQRAPSMVVQRERDRLEELRAQLSSLTG